MLTGFEDESEDQSGWLAALVLWAGGGAAGLLVAISTNMQTLMHVETASLAIGISIVSIVLRLPAFACRHTVPVSLCHALWIFGVFAQLNWGGFLAFRASDGWIAAEGLILCIAAEVWFTALLWRQGKLPWLVEIRAACVDELQGRSSGAGEELRQASGKETPQQRVVESSGTEQPLESTELSRGVDSEVESMQNDEVIRADEDAGLVRVLRDCVDANGERFLAGMIRFEMLPTQRTETLVISFCPALAGAVELELETDSEDLVARVENCTECGARVSVKRQQASEAAVFTLEWYARAAAATTAVPSSVLP